MGLVALTLMAWGVHANRQCSTYDAGRPFWQCEAPYFFLALLNAPAVALVRPIVNLLLVAPSFRTYLYEMPFILFLWWFIGTRIDFGILGVGAYRRRRAWVAVLSVAAAVLLEVLSWSVSEEIAFHRSYPSFGGFGYFRLLGDLMSLPVYLWLVALFPGLGIAIIRISRGQTGQTDRTLARPVTKRLAALGFAAYCACASGLLWHARNVERRTQAEYDLRSVIIKGRVVDDRGLPVYAIEVDLVPTFVDSELQWARAIRDWTNENGEFIFRPEDKGRYFLSVLWDAPPSSRLPFLPRYYPDATEQSQAEILEITPALHLNLAPIKLHRLELVKVPVSMSWLNGKAEPGAYLLFNNPLFPNHGAIGDESMHPDKEGMVSLPAGFEYQASAQVDCDAGQRISSARTPLLTFSTKPGISVAPLHLVFPGEPCNVWHPK